MPPVTRKARAAARNLGPLITFGKANTLMHQTRNSRKRPREAKTSRVNRSKRNNRAVRRGLNAGISQPKAPEQPSVVADSPSSPAKPRHRCDSEVSAADEDTPCRPDESIASVEVPNTPLADTRGPPARAEWEPSYQRGLREFCNAIDPGARGCYYYLLSSSEDSDLEEETPRDKLYREISYLPPLNDSELKLIRRVRREPNMNRDGKRIDPSKERKFADGLTKRNVSLTPSPDPAFRQHLGALEPTAHGESADEKSAHSRTWLLDLKKACADKLEALFQRTVLISVIDQHRLVHHQEGDDSSRDPYLDFVVERPWTCPPTPSRVFQEANLQILSQPKRTLPSLSVGKISTLPIRAGADFR